MSTNTDNDIETVADAIRELSEELLTYDRLVEVQENNGLGPTDARAIADLNEVMRRMVESVLIVDESEHLSQTAKVVVLAGLVQTMQMVTMTGEAIMAGEVQG